LEEQHNCGGVKAVTLLRRQSKTEIIVCLLQLFEARLAALRVV
jgi:hypothetical protein